MARSRTPFGVWRRVATAMCVAVASLVMSAQPTYAVVGGSSAVGNTAVVRILNGSSSCSGALWTSRIVVTAAHCVVNSSGTVTTRPISIYAPGVNTQQSPQTVSQSSIITVDGWRKLGEYSQADDIAFLVLGNEMTGVSISRLATTNEVAAWSREGRVVTFLGYGRTSSTGTSSTVPNSIDQPLSVYPSWPGSFTAAQTATTGICSGDSGGPVITRVGNEVVLIGINSAASGPCSASSRPSMTGFIPSAFPDLVKRTLELTNTVVLPLVTTGSATGVSTTSAILSATAVGNNLLTTVSFTYGLQPDLSGATITVEAGQVTGTTPTAVEVAIINLVPGNVYYFRANATNLAGTVSGSVAQFTTLGGLPIVTSVSASAVASDSAVLSGTVNANSVATQAFFQYSRLPDFSVLDGTVVAGDVTGGETASLSVPIAALEAGAMYYWRLAATNASGTTVGATQSFTTPVFGRSTSLSANALLNNLVIDKTAITKLVIAPTTKSKPHCAINTKSKRLTFSKPGTCRVRITITRADATSTGVYNLAVK
ncbi:MAG: trypsin-like serine protease [Actinomycetota bacterium]